MCSFYGAIPTFSHYTLSGPHLAREARSWFLVQSALRRKVEQNARVGAEYKTFAAG